MSPQKHVVFDVVGTLVSYDAFFEGVARILGPKLLSHGIKPSLFAFAWYESAEREFAYLSVSSRYVPFNTVFRALFYRILHMSGISDPRAFASDEQRDAVLETFMQLKPREGAKEALDLLRGAGFKVWCFTTADIERVQGYFRTGGIEMPREDFTSCDEEGVAKPALKAYESVLKKLEKDDVKWFAAAHMWDASAAVCVGFRGAYCTVYERESCAAIFGGDLEVMSDTLPEMARKIIAAS